MAQYVADEWAGLVDVMDSKNNGSLEQITRLNELEKRSHFIQHFLIGLLIVIMAVPFLFAWWISANSDYVRDVQIDNVRIVGPSALCPGDTLFYEFDFTGKGRGTLDNDETLWRVSPPATLITSETSRYILAGDFSRHVRRTFIVPHGYFDEATGQAVPLAPGTYHRLLSISSPTRSDTVDVDHVEFTVKEGCLP